MGLGEEMTVKRIHIQRPKTRRERDWREALTAEARDPDVVGAKAHARGAVSRRQVNGQVSRPARNPRMQAG